MQVLLVFSDQAILLEPPKPIKKSDYICVRRFHLDSILEMYKSERNFGVVTVSGKEFYVYSVSQSVLKTYRF